MNLKKLGIFAALLATPLMMLPLGAAADTIEIAGEVLYRERIALPEDASLQVQLIQIAKNRKNQEEPRRRRSQDQENDGLSEEDCSRMSRNLGWWHSNGTTCGLSSAQTNARFVQPSVLWCSH